jgi:hypothetical protein
MIVDLSFAQNQPNPMGNATVAASGKRQSGHELNAFHATLGDNDLAECAMLVSLHYYQPIPTPGAVPNPITNG